MKYVGKLVEIPKEISIKQDSFEKDAHGVGIYNLTEFYNSNVFKNKNRIVEKHIISELS